MRMFNHVLSSVKNSLRKIFGLELKIKEREKKMHEAMVRDVEHSAGGHLSKVGRGLK